MDFLEFSDVTAEVRGAMAPGRLKLTDQHIIFKNSKTGKVEQFNANEVDIVNWQRISGSWGLRVFLKNGTLHRYGSLKESDQDKLAKFFTQHYNTDMLEKELAIKGWNWGTAKFNGSILSFDVNTQTAFEIPLNNVSQCMTGKNEVTLEFHQNDDAPLSLMEMRFHIPSSELAGEDPVDSFHDQVMRQASVISATGDAIAIFREIQCLTPRGRYDIKMFQSFFQLHGKTFDYKIPMSTVLRLFQLPHRDGRQMFFVVSLDPPIKQGQTRYHFLVFQFGKEEEVSIELPLTEEELATKYEGKLDKELSGPLYEVISKVMKAMVNRKITAPGPFIGHSGTAAIGCSYKAAAGYLYPLERGFIYIHKPPIHIRFEEINSVNFARSGGSTRSFDFEVEIKAGLVHTFSSIEKEEYGKLYDFILGKKLRMKNRSKLDKQNYSMDDFGNSDQEDEPDAYLARVKAEAEERDDDDGGGSSDESEDEDFKPNEDLSDVAEEFDSNPSDSTDSDEAAAGAGSGENKDKEPKKSKKPKTAKTISEKPRRPKKTKKPHEEGKPKRPQSAYFIWMNASREKINEKYPGLTVAEFGKKAGELWKEITDKTEWDAKAVEAKEKYAEAMKEWVASGGGAAGGGNGGSSPKKRKSVSKPAIKSPGSAPANVTGGSGSGFKSKEYISDDSSSSDGEKKHGRSDKSDDDESGKESKPKKKAPAKKTTPKKADAKKSTPKKGAAMKKELMKAKEESVKSSASDEDSEKDELKIKEEDTDKDEDSEKESKSKKKPAPKKQIKKEGKKKEVVKEEIESDVSEEILSTPTASSASASDSE